MFCVYYERVSDKIVSWVCTVRDYNTCCRLAVLLIHQVLLVSARLDYLHFSSYPRFDIWPITWIPGSQSRRRHQETTRDTDPTLNRCWFGVSCRRCAADCLSRKLTKPLPPHKRPPLNLVTRRVKFTGILLTAIRGMSSYGHLIFKSSHSDHGIVCIWPCPDMHNCHDIIAI